MRVGADKGTARKYSIKFELKLNEYDQQSKKHE